MEKINGVYAVNNAICGGLKQRDLSNAEITSRHGEIITYELNKPQPYEVFETWPETIQREYLKKLYWQNCGTTYEIADMLGVYQKKVYDMLSNFSIPTRKKICKRSTTDREKWRSFIHGNSCVKDVINSETAAALADLKDALPKTAEKEEYLPKGAMKNIAAIRDKVMKHLSELPDDEFAGFVDCERFESIIDKDNTMCAFCRDIFGACRAEFDACPVQFTEWAMMTDSEEDKVEFLKRWAKEDTRVRREKWGVK